MTAVVNAHRGIVTPQGVVLDLEVAGVGYRGGARLIDTLVMLAGLAITGQFADMIGGTTGIVTILLAVMVIVFAYPVVAETFFRGRTIGKAAMGLRVVTLEAGPIGFREALIRSLFQLVDILASFGIVALLAGMSSSRAQRLGDLAAGTFVIRDPRSVARVPPVPFTPPMGTEAMVASLDVSKLRPEQERVVRSFLLRVGSLSTPARVDLGQRIAQNVAQRLGHDPDHVGDPETYLVAVMAARQLREGGLAELALDRPEPTRRRFRRRASEAPSVPS